MNSNYKDLFSVDKNLIYLNHAALSPLTRAAHEKMIDLLNKKATAGTYHFDISKLEENFRKAAFDVASFLHAKTAAEIAFPFSTAVGLLQFFSGIPIPENKHEIITTDLEFPTNYFPYLEYAKKHGLKLKVVNHDENGAVPISAFEKMVTDNTFLVAVSHVQFSNGYRVNLKELAQLCHEHGSFLLVDAIQSAGAVPLDVQKYDIDALSAGGYKWLAGPLGTGIFYCKEELIEQLQPPLIGWFSAEDWHNMNTRPFVPAKSARRIQSSFSFHNHALVESIKVFNTIGIKEMWGNLNRNMSFLIDQLNNIDEVSIASPIEKENERSGILRMEFNDPTINVSKIVKRLHEQRIVVAERTGGIRISPHFYNTKDDLGCFVDTLKAMLKSLK